MFSIYFDDERQRELGPPDAGARYGTIVLAGDRETFLSSQMYWDSDRYQAHWRAAVARVLDERRDSCLITSLADPGQSHLLFWWLMYPAGDEVVFQNGILFFDQLPEPFDPDRPFRSIPQRVSVNEDGDPISEWHVPHRDVRAFLHGEVRSRQLNRPAV